MLDRVLQPPRDFGAKEENILTIVKFLFRNRPISEDDFKGAANSGYLDVIKFFVNRNVPVPKDAILEAAWRGRVDIVWYLNHIMSELLEVPEVPKDTLSKVFLPPRDFKTNEVETLAIVEILYHRQLDSRDMYNAASNDLQSVVKYLMSVGSPIDTSTMTKAIELGNLNFVKMLLKNNAPINENTIVYAFTLSRNRRQARIRFVIAKYLFENGVPIDTKAIENAAWSGNLEGVKYLVENKAPVELNTIMFHAVTSGEIRIVKYLGDKGYPITRLAIKAADEIEDEKIIDYLYRKSAELGLEEETPLIPDIAKLTLSYL